MDGWLPAGVVTFSLLLAATLLKPMSICESSKKMIEDAFGMGRVRPFTTFAVTMFSGTRMSRERTRSGRLLPLCSQARPLHSASAAHWQLAGSQRRCDATRRRSNWNVPVPFRFTVGSLPTPSPSPLLEKKVAWPGENCATVHKRIILRYQLLMILFFWGRQCRIHLGRPAMSAAYYYFPNFTCDCD